MNRAVIAIISLTLTGCGAAEETVGYRKDAQDTTLPISREALAELVRQVKLDPCGRDDKSVQCLLEDVQLSTGSGSMASGSEETILLVDNFPELFPGILRYRNRLAGYYRWRDDGSFESTPYGWTLPSTFVRVMNSVVSPSFVSALDLWPLAEPLSEAYWRFNPLGGAHGNDIFRIVAELNPRHRIVLMDAPVMPRDLYCQPVLREGDIEALEIQMMARADAVREVIRRHNVRFVNVSWGRRVQDLRWAWLRGFGCEGPAPRDEIIRAKLLTMAPIFRVLFGTEGVIATHAASYEVPDPWDAPFDVPSEAYPNRIRIGAFGSADSGLDDHGRGPNYAFDTKPPVAGADAFLNSGIVRVRPLEMGPTPLLRADDFGVDLVPVDQARSTSWIAPLALSRLVHLRSTRHGDTAMTNSTVRELQDEMMPRLCPELPDGRCVYQDPLRHGQVEVVRLGYRPHRVELPHRN